MKAVYTSRGLELIVESVADVEQLEDLIDDMFVSDEPIESPVEMDESTASYYEEYLDKLSTSKVDQDTQETRDPCLNVHQMRARVALAQLKVINEKYDREIRPLILAAIAECKQKEC